MSSRTAIASAILGKKYKVIHADNPILGTDSWFRRKWRQWEIDCVIDIGANVGQFANEIWDSGYDGRMISFEPSPKTFEELSKNRYIKSKEWELHQIALGAEPGRLQFHQFESSVMNSFRPPTEEFSQISKPNLDEMIEVEVDTLDRLVENKRVTIGARNFIKIDTQGFDFETLKGCEGLLSKATAIQIELSFVSLYKGTALAMDVMAYLLKRGFLPSSFSPAAFDKKQNYLFQVDGLFLNNQHIDYKMGLG